MIKSRFTDNKLSAVIFALLSTSFINLSFADSTEILPSKEVTRGLTFFDFIKYDVNNPNAFPSWMNTKQIKLQQLHQRKRPVEALGLGCCDINEDKVISSPLIWGLEKPAALSSPQQVKPIVNSVPTAFPKAVPTTQTKTSPETVAAGSETKLPELPEVAQTVPKAEIQLTASEEDALSLANSISPTTVESVTTLPASEQSLSSDESNALDLANQLGGKEPSDLTVTPTSDDPLLGQIEGVDASLLTESAQIDPNSTRQSFNATAEVKFTNERQNQIVSSSLILDWTYFFSDTQNLVFKNRLTTEMLNRNESKQTTNYLQELYYVMAPHHSFFINAGRINNRNGVAVGYNPNDYLAIEQTEQTVSFDPEVSRKARVGNVSVNFKKLWDKSALNVVVSPELSDIGSDNSADLKLSQSNPDFRFVAALNLEYVTNLSAQILTYLSKKEHPQFGFNLSFPVKDDLVAYGEVSTGKKTSTFDAAVKSDVENWHTQFAIGARWTPFTDVSFTGEFLYDDSALDRNQINTLRQINPNGYEGLRQLKLINQQLFGQYSTFTRVDWNNAFIDNLKFSAFNLYDLEDKSYVNWVELRYQYKDFDFAVQYFQPRQRNVGPSQNQDVLSFEANYFY